VLSEIGQAIQGEGGFPDFSSLSLGSGLTDGENILLQKSGQCLEWLNCQKEDFAKPIRKVMGSIIRGQSNDLRRFSSNNLEFLKSDEELDQYLYDVAGSVGVFWTEIGFISYGDKFSIQDNETLIKLGADYGKSLQLINILRDFSEDFISGRCYFPGNFDNYTDQEIWEEVSEHWIARCRFLMRSSSDYVEALRSPRIRFSTGLPAIIGVETLNLIQKATWKKIEDPIKVDRKRVKLILFQTAMSSLTNRGISKRILKSLKV
ncbi:MAG: squalene/phytoene synthase family protein, partial [Verrucomicrobiota bacterium]|nr:squalene/phytoene synthase family protein [Verrucomicrobiota bacterium]